MHTRLDLLPPPLAMSSGTEQAVRSFLRFALSKRRAQLREVEIAAEEVASAKARTGMAVFNAQDVQDVIAEVKVAVKRAAERELVDLAHNSALLLRLCLDEASGKGVNLEPEMASLEDMDLLVAIKQSDEAQASQPASAFSFKRRTGGLVALSSDANEAASAAGRRLGTDNAALLGAALKSKGAAESAAGEAAQAKAEAERLRAALATAEREAEVLRAKAEAAEAKAAAAAPPAVVNASDALEAARRELAAVNAKHSAEVEELTSQLSTAKLEASAAGSEASAKVSASKQVQMMKQMMQKKSQELVEVRRRLAKYEPEVIKSAD